MTREQLLDVRLLNPDYQFGDISLGGLCRKYGYALVPVEPTEAMLQGLYGATPAEVGKTWYARMLKAAAIEEGER